MLLQGWTRQIFPISIYNNMDRYLYYFDPQYMERMKRELVSQHKVLPFFSPFSFLLSWKIKLTMASNFYKLPISFFVGQHFSNKTDGADHQYFHLYLIVPFSTYVVVLMGNSLYCWKLTLSVPSKLNNSVLTYWKQVLACTWCSNMHLWFYHFKWSLFIFSFLMDICKIEKMA